MARQGQQQKFVIPTAEVRYPLGRSLWAQWSSLPKSSLLLGLYCTGLPISVCIMYAHNEIIVAQRGLNGYGKVRCNDCSVPEKKPNHRRRQRIRKSHFRKNSSSFQIIVTDVFLGCAFRFRGSSQHALSCDGLQARNSALRDSPRDRYRYLFGAAPRIVLAGAFTYAVWHTLIGSGAARNVLKPNRSRLPLSAVRAET